MGLAHIRCAWQQSSWKGWGARSCSAGQQTSMGSPSPTPSPPSPTTSTSSSTPQVLLSYCTPLIHNRLTIRLRYLNSSVGKTVVNPRLNFQRGSRKRTDPEIFASMPDSCASMRTIYLSTVSVNVIFSMLSQFRRSHE